MPPKAAVQRYIKTGVHGRKAAQPRKEVNTLARTNYGYEKRQKELAKQKKKAEKQQKKLERAHMPADGQQEPEQEETGQESPGEAKESD